MPLARPTLPELIDRASADFETRLPGVDARLRRSNLAVLGRVHAGAVHGLYGYLQWLARQIFADTAEVEFLEKIGGIYEIARKAAAQAKGSVLATGTNGVLIPAGTLLQRADRTEYTTDADATITSGPATVAVTGRLGGQLANAAAGTTMTIVSPISDINSTCIVATGGLSAGADTESDDLYRGRVLDRIRQPPHGGAAFDYVKWALEVPGVTRAWCAPKELGIGTVTLRFVRDDDGDIIPGEAEVDEVQQYIEARRPVTSDVTVVAPAPVPLHVTIAGLTPGNQAVKDAVTAELTDLLRRESSPGATILLSHIREAVSIAAAEFDHAVGLPSGNVTHMQGQMATMGTVAWA